MGYENLMNSSRKYTDPSMYDINLKPVKYAGFMPRFYAFIIDVVFIFLASILFYFVVIGIIYAVASVMGGTSLSMLMLANAISIRLVYIAYPISFLYLFGATPGKMLIGLRVVPSGTPSTDKRGISLSSSTLRSLSYPLIVIIISYIFLYLSQDYMLFIIMSSLISFAVGGLNLFLLAYTPNHRSLMDRIAGTSVIKL